MMRSCKSLVLLLMLTGWGPSALGCAVCFGDPESEMAKGAVAGVAFMIGVVGFVLTGIASTALFWLHRSRRLSKPADSV